VNKQHPRWYQEPWVWLLISFPLAAVIGGIITLLLALDSNDGLVVDDYYRQGMEINRVLERDQLAADFAIDARLQFSEDQQTFRLFLDGNNDFIPPASLQISFLHATRSGYDQKMELHRADKRIYTGKLAPLVRGFWHVQIETDRWRVLESLEIR
jgi:hypothetical protein